MVLTIRGTDVGELRDAPFLELEKDLADPRPFDLFIDARDTRGASIDVSNDWARWLHEHRPSLQRVTMLPGSRFIRMTADFVRRFAEMGERMWVTTDPVAFDEALAAAIRSASSG